MALSVKNRLLALFGCFLAGFLLVFAVDFLEGRSTARTTKLEHLSIAVQIDVLGMRRQEKNYFLRHDPGAFAAVQRLQQTAVANMRAIRDLDADHDPICDTAIGLLTSYRTAFEALADAPGGANTPATLFLETSQALEQLGGTVPELAQNLGRLRHLEKRWLASGTLTNRQRLEAEGAKVLEAARQGGPERAGAVKLVSDYLDALRAYAGRLEEAGSSSAAFVAAARALEPMTETLRDHYATRRARIAVLAERVSWMIQAVVIILVGLAAWAVFRSVAIPLGVISRHARRVARGEETNLDPNDFTGEFYELAKDISRMERHLVATILDLGRKEREAADEARRAREARKRAEDLSRVKSNFLNLVSHELKTPLTSMVGFTQVMLKRLRRGPLTEQAAFHPELALETARLQENLGIMLAEGRRLSGLIDNVLELAALESGQSGMALDTVAVSEVVERAAEPFLDAMSSKGLRFLCDIPVDMPLLRCDRDRMVYVLRHLFSNAVKFTEAGHIACRARYDGNMATISVEDTGQGIPPEMHEAVFEKFLQLGDNLTGKIPGLGIGLAASRAVMETHGGSIHIAGEPGRGSTVTVSIPLARER